MFFSDWKRFCCRFLFRVLAFWLVDTRSGKLYRRDFDVFARCVVYQLFGRIVLLNKTVCYQAGFRHFYITLYGIRVFAFTVCLNFSSLVLAPFLDPMF